MKSAEALASITTEAELLQAVRDLAGFRRWLCFHTHDSRRSEPGFPDLVLVRGGRVVYAELKTERGRLSVDQRIWQDALVDAGCEFHVWRPSSWNEIEEALR